MFQRPLHPSPWEVEESTPANCHFSPIIEERIRGGWAVSYETLVVRQTVGWKVQVSMVGERQTIALSAVHDIEPSHGWPVATPYAFSNYSFWATHFLLC